MSERSDIIETLLDIEDDANHAGGLSIDQRLTVVWIRASLAQTAAIEHQADIAARAAGAMELLATAMPPAPPESTPPHAEAVGTSEEARAHE